MNAGGWHFSHGVEALGVLNIPSGPPVGEAHVARRDRGVAAAASPTCTGCSATSRRRTPTPRARAASIPARDLNLTIAGDHPSEQYLMASSGLEALPLLGSACDERDGAHLAEDLAIVEVIDRRTGRPLRPRRARQPRRHGAREGQLPPALRPRGRRAAGTRRRARAARRTAGSSTRAACATSSPVGDARGAADRRGARALRVPRGVDAVGGVPDRAAGRAGAGRCTSAASTARASTSAGARARASPSASASGSASRARLELVPRGAAAALRLQGGARRRRVTAGPPGVDASSRVG